MHLTDEFLFARAIEQDLYMDQIEVVIAQSKDEAQRERVFGLLKAHAQSGTGQDILERAKDVYQVYTSVALRNIKAEEVKADVRTIGPYQILEKIGEGGMGLVYSAQQVQPIERKVALKLLKPGMDSKRIMRRFELEKKVLQQMKHPGLTQILDAGIQPNGRPFFAMELVENAKNVMNFADCEKLTIRERIQLTAQICEVVQHAHQRGVIHRDLKPSNILVTVQDGKPRVKVIDFGIAKAVSTELDEYERTTAVYDCMGTIEYMSPEHLPWRNGEIDGRSDVYSLGVLLFELLVGETQHYKWNGEHRNTVGLCATLESKDQNSIENLAQLRKTGQAAMKRLLSRELEWICMKACAVDKEERYQSVAELKRDLERFLDGRPVEAAKPSLAYFTTKFVLRNKILSVVAALSTLAIISTSIIASWFAFRATSAERIANLRLQEVLAAQQDLQIQTEKVKQAHQKTVARTKVKSVETAFLRAFDVYYNDLMESLKNPTSQFNAQTKFIEPEKCFDVDFLWSPHQNLAIRGNWDWVHSRGVLDTSVNTYRLSSDRIQQLTSATTTHISLGDESYLDPGQSKLLVAENMEYLRVRFQKLALRELAKQLERNDPLIAEALDNCAMNSLAQKDYEQAEEYLRESIKIWSFDQNYPSRLGQSSLFLAHCLRLQGKYEEANAAQVVADQQIESRVNSEKDRKALSKLAAKLIAVSPNTFACQ